MVTRAITAMQSIKCGRFKFRISLIRFLILIYGLGIALGYCLKPKPPAYSTIEWIRGGLKGDVIEGADIEGPVIDYGGVQMPPSAISTTTCMIKADGRQYKFSSKILLDKSRPHNVHLVKDKNTRKIRWWVMRLD